MSFPSPEKFVTPFDTSATDRSIGNLSCPCLNATAFLSFVLDEGNCTYNEVLSNIMKTEVPCVPVDYGTGCAAHDINSCKDGEWCAQEWCYVNRTTCYPSKFEMAQSTYFDGIYYSFSTCGSVDKTDDFLRFSSTHNLKDKVLKSTIPKLSYPFIFKKDPKTGENITSPVGNSGGPYYGVMMDYVKKLEEIAKEDNMTFTFQPRSGGSSVRKPDNVYTAAVTDIQAGISDVSTERFWITSERLALTTFTVPLLVSPLYVFEKDREEQSIMESAMQMWQPFHILLWVLLGVSVVIVGMLNVWFASRRGERSAWREALSSEGYKRSSLLRRFIVYNQLCLASVLDSFVQCFGGGVEMDPESTFPSKIVAFGFGFFVLITISSYTANLTSFLTAKASNSYIRSMDDAVTDKKRLCASGVLKSMLKTKWKGAQFTFQNNPGGFDYIQAIQDVSSGKCDALLAELYDVESNATIYKELCDKNLITTRVRALDLNIAFPIKEEYAAGLSHYMKKLEQNGTTFETILKNYNTQQCDLVLENSVSSNPQMTIKHMLIPIMVLCVCIFISCCLKLTNKRKPKIFQAFDKTLVKKDDDSDGDTDTFDNNPNDIGHKKSQDTGKHIPESANPRKGNSGNQIEEFHQSLYQISKDVMQLSHDMKLKRSSGV